MLVFPKAKILGALPLSIMGKGAVVPVLVVFLGAIGGFMAFGFIGLFLGAIILSLAYKLYVTWIAYE